MPERQFTAPMILENGEALQLERLPFGERTYDEVWLRDLLWDHPSLLPVTEIEPVFEGLQPVAWELQTASGLIDLLFVNAGGMMTVVETKLWRNPEARRKVVAQIIDYAKDLAAWSYSELVAAVKTATGSTDADPIVAAACEEGDETAFIDDVSRNLRLGRFLLLIVGDGIREGVEEMSNYLQKTPNLGFTLGLVELALFRKGSGTKATVFVQPRILARTVELERAVVTLKVPVRPEDIEISTPALPRDGTASAGGRRNPTAAEFYEILLANAGPKAVAFVEWALEEGQKLDLRIEWKGTGPFLKYQDEDSGRWKTVASFSKHGHLCGGKTGPPKELRHAYLDEIAAFIPGATRRVGNWPSAQKYGSQALYVDDAPGVPLSLLDDHRDEWLTAFKRLIAKLAETQE